MGTGDSNNGSSDSGSEYIIGCDHFIGSIRLWKKCLQFINKNIHDGCQNTSFLTYENNRYFLHYCQEYSNKLSIIEKLYYNTSTPQSVKILNVYYLIWCFI